MQTVPSNASPDFTHCRDADLRHAAADAAQIANADRLESNADIGSEPDSKIDCKIDSDIDSKIDSEIGDALDLLIAGAPLKDVSGISSEMMDALYAQAYRLYQENRLDDAENFFRLLCIYDFHNVDYALGLGAVYQLKKNYEKAIELYAAAYIIGNKELRPILYAGQCGLMMKDTLCAKQCFELVMDESEDTELRSLAQSYLSALNANTAPCSTGVTQNEPLAT